MIPQEFKTQIFKTPDQWGSGLFYRLEQPKEGGVTLYSTPTFTRWIQGIEGIEITTSLAVDECGQIYFIGKVITDKKDTYALYRYDPGTQRLEQMLSIDSCDADREKCKAFSRMLIDKFTAWVLNKGNHRVQAFSRENFQVKYIIANGLEEPVDVGIDENGYLYILDKKAHRIHKYSVNGVFVGSFGMPHLEEPIGLVIGKENTLYVIDIKNKEKKRSEAWLLKFIEQGKEPIRIRNFNEIFEEFKPSFITIDKKGNIFVVGEETGQIYQFDPDGSYVGNASIPDLEGPIKGLAVDDKGNLYAITNRGIAVLSVEQRFTKEKGYYYSKTLDSGIQKCQWHRLALEAEIPPRSLVEVSYFMSDDSSLKTRIDTILLNTSNASVQKIKEDLDKEIPENKWIGHETFSELEKREKSKTDFVKKEPLVTGPGGNKWDMLFRKATGRYLWLKVVVSTFDEKTRPAITRMKVYYPRMSYLRYLPATYQEDEASKEFLERFLSLFETVFYDAELEISRVFRYFDPNSTPQNFLTWLASWLNLALEEGWPEDKKRQFIQQAVTLYKLKGTPVGIGKLLEIYTGKKTFIIEHAKAGKPLVLSERGTFKLGIDSVLSQTPIRGFRLGKDAILGRVALRDVALTPEDPFISLANQFTVVVDLSPGEVTRYEKGLKRIIDEEKPAHTAYNLRVIREMRLGRGMYVGISTRVASYQPLHLGVDAVIGSGMAIMSGEQGGRVERHSRVGEDTELI